MDNIDDDSNYTKHLIFVYGTLKRGCRNNHYLKDATFLDIAETVNRYIMKKHVGNYPAALESDTKYTIPGELWLCSEETAKSIDRLEDYPYLFYREEVLVKCKSKEQYNGYAWMYFFSKDNPASDLKEQILEWEE